VSRAIGVTLLASRWRYPLPERAGGARYFSKAENGPQIVRGTVCPTDIARPGVGQSVFLRQLEKANGGEFVSIGL